MSEIMLQQTQVSTVIPYFNTFIETYPTVEDLARASIDDVLHLWTGLGYYARGRNLHKCAQKIVSDYDGVFPNDVEGLCELPGIGRSTAGAICSIAYQKSTAILDGNVKRVLARHHAVEGWPGVGSVQKALWVFAEQHTPEKRCNHYTQAIMDLGATLCTRSKPQCELCPLSESCQAFAQGRQKEFPGSKPKKDKPSKSTQLLMIRNPQGEILLQQRPEQGIWGGLWSFPELALDDCPETFCEMKFSKARELERWDSYRHTFSHYHLDITPVLLQLEREPRVLNENKSHWMNLKQPASLGLAAPVKKLLNTLAELEPLS